jgi:hypothetical protein
MELLHAEGQTDRPDEGIVAFCNFANAPKTSVPLNQWQSLRLSQTPFILQNPHVQYYVHKSSALDVTLKKLRYLYSCYLYQFPYSIYSVCQMSFPTEFPL